MSYTSFLDSVFNPLLLPLLNWNPFWAIVLISLIISVFITVLYKFVTNQDLMRELKTKQKEFQKKMKGLRSEPEKMMKVQKEAMKVNADYMKQSFKPTLITFIPILLIFGWLAAHLAFEPIMPGQTYSVTASFEEGVSGDALMIVSSGSTLLSEASQLISGDVTWRLKSELGEHFLTIKAEDDEQTKKVLVSTDLDYEEAILEPENSPITKIEINYAKLRPLGPGFNIFGWEPGWLGLYIIFSIIFSTVLRKVMKIY